MSTDADKVRAAADYIERVGLHKGSIAEGELPARESVEQGLKCCTLGSLWGHGVETWTPYPTRPFDGRDLLAEFLSVGDVAEWNDDPERTAEEVVAGLRAWADALDSGAST